jgi:hypothetical protein
MAQYETKAYCWSDNGYNATYSTSVTATFDDDDGAYQGGGDSNETISIDGGAFDASASNPYVIEIDFTTPDGETFTENFQFFYVDGKWYFAPGVDSEFIEGSTLGTYQSHSVGWNYNDIVCFAGGTLIATSRGQVPVDDLRPGDLVQTISGESRPLLWSMVRRLGPVELARNPNLRPVRISAGSLGSGLPKRDLLVSRQHRMLLRSQIVNRMTGQHSALVSALHLTNMDGIAIDHSVQRVDYHHLLFDLHEILFAEGAPSESLHLGPQTIKTLPKQAIDEVEALFGTLGKHFAAPCPPSSKQRRMVMRHMKNSKPLVSH